MALVRWNPIGTLAGMEVDRLNQMFANFQTEAFNQAWVPAVDIYETDSHEVVIKAELPDVKKEDIGVTVENNVLTLTGERKQEASAKREQFQRDRASLRQLQPLVHAAGVGRCGTDCRVLQGWRADHPAAAPRRGEAEADLRQRRITSETVERTALLSTVSLHLTVPLAKPAHQPASGADPPFRLLLQHAAKPRPAGLGRRGRRGHAVRHSHHQPVSLRRRSRPARQAAPARRVAAHRSARGRAHAAQARTRGDGGGQDGPDSLHPADARRAPGQGVGRTFSPGTSQSPVA